MPLMSGNSRKTISENIKELMDSYKRKGSIGNSGNINAEDARKRAIAIAYAKSRQ